MKKSQAIYSSIYEYEHTGWVLGYQSIARYHKDIDTVVIMFLSTTGGETILLRDVIYSRVMDIIRERDNETSWYTVSGIALLFGPDVTQCLILYV